MSVAPSALRIAISFPFLRHHQAAACRGCRSSRRAIASERMMNVANRLELQSREQVLVDLAPIAHAQCRGAPIASRDDLRHERSPRRCSASSTFMSIALIFLGPCPRSTPAPKSMRRIDVRSRRIRTSHCRRLAAMRTLPGARHDAHRSEVSKRGYQRDLVADVDVERLCELTPDDEPGAHWQLGVDDAFHERIEIAPSRSRPEPEPESDGSSIAASCSARRQGRGR